MERIKSLLEPHDCALLLVDFQAGLAFGVESSARQSVLHNAIALAQTAAVFEIPVIASTSASKVYSGPMFPSLQAAIPNVKPIERRSMNAWEDDSARAAILGTSRKRLIVAGLLTEACVSFPVLSALEHGLEVFVVADACGGLTLEGHQHALERMKAGGAQMTSWIQVLLEFQRDWTRHATYEGARSIVESNGGGYGMGLTYAREMIQPG
jgi:nicotinamidase-related amidase